MSLSLSLFAPQGLVDLEYDLLLLAAFTAAEDLTHPSHLESDRGQLWLAQPTLLLHITTR